MSQELKDRTKKFAIDVACLCADIPNAVETNNARGQLQPAPRVAEVRLVAPKPERRRRTQRAGLAPARQASESSSD